MPEAFVIFSTLGALSYLAAHFGVDSRDGADWRKEPEA